MWVPPSLAPWCLPVPPESAPLGWRRRVVGAWPLGHWIASDADLLTQYCTAAELFEKARRRHDHLALDKAGRLRLTYATKLRLTPQSRYHQGMAEREAERGKENAAAAGRLLGRNAWAKLPRKNPN